MNTSAHPLPILETSDEGRIAEHDLIYFRARTKNRAHDEVLAYFLKCAKSSGLTKAQLARRLGRRPEQITRWLSAPSNWTLDTVSDLLTAMEAELGVSVGALSDLRTVNECHAIAETPRYTIRKSQRDTEDEAQGLETSVPKGVSLVRHRMTADVNS